MNTSYTDFITVFTLPLILPILFLVTDRQLLYVQYIKNSQLGCVSVRPHISFCSKVLNGFGGKLVLKSFQCIHVRTPSATKIKRSKYSKSHFGCDIDDVRVQLAT
jgi:hypothetical protein